MEAVDVGENGGSARGDAVGGEEFVEVAKREVEALCGLKSLRVKARSIPPSIVWKTKAGCIKIELYIERKDKEHSQDWLCHCTFGQDTGRRHVRDGNLSSGMRGDSMEVL